MTAIQALWDRAVMKVSASWAWAGTQPPMSSHQQALLMEREDALPLPWSFCVDGHLGIRIDLACTLHKVGFSSL